MNSHPHHHREVWKRPSPGERRGRRVFEPAPNTATRPVGNTHTHTHTPAVCGSTTVPVHGSTTQSRASSAVAMTQRHTQCRKLGQRAFCVLSSPLPEETFTAGTSWGQWTCCSKEANQWKRNPEEEIITIGADTGPGNIHDTHQCSVWMKYNKVNSWVSWPQGTQRGWQVYNYRWLKIPGFHVQANTGFGDYGFELWITNVQNRINSVHICASLVIQNTPNT